LKNYIFVKVSVFFRVVTLPGKTWNLRNFEKKNLEKPGILYKKPGKNLNFEQF